MPTAASLALAAWRHEPRLFQIIVRGIDLTNRPMVLEVRLSADTPGAPLLRLTEAAGLHLEGVTVEDAVTVSTVSGLISQAQMEALPYAGELGDNAPFAFNLQLAGVTRAYGCFTALATVNGADAAPTNRPAGYGGSPGTVGLWDTATLAIGTDTIEITVDGTAIIEQIAAGLSAQAVELTTQALVTATIASALAGAVAAVPVDGNPNELTAPDVPTPIVNSTFDVLIVVTNTGETNLTAGGLRQRITDGGGVPIAAGRLQTGTIVTLSDSEGGAFVLSNPRSINQTPAINAQLATLTSVTEQVLGVAIGYTVGGNVNEIAAPDVAPPVPNVPFEVLLTATNTAPANITAGGFRQAITDGGGTPVVAGRLVKNTIVSLSLGGGGAFVLGGSRPVIAPKNPNGTEDPDINNRPYGAASFSPTGVLTVAPIVKTLIVAGSSNANPGYVPAPQLPALVAANYLTQFIGGGITFSGVTTAVPGAPMVNIMDQLNARPEFTSGQVSFVIPFFWMNDARTVYYHSEGGILAQLAALRAAIPLIRAKGAEPILVTGFHPDPRAPAAALDPTFFSDARAFPDGGSAQEMDFPAFKTAPVDPQAQMLPSAANALERRDWSGNGIVRKGYTRLWHVNRLIRELAESTGCVLLDIEVAFFRDIVEKLPDQDPGLETYFDSSSTGAGPLHPRPALYDVCVSPLLREWAFAVAQGRTDQRVFNGTNSSSDLIILGDRIDEEVAARAALERTLYGVGGVGGDLPALGEQIAQGAADAANQSTELRRAYGTAPILGDSYDVYNTFAADGRAQIVSVRRSDAKVFTIVSNNDDIVSGGERGGVIPLSRPNGLVDSNGATGRDAWFVPAEGGAFFPYMSNQNIICLGESTTQGGPDADAAHCLPAYLAALLGFARVDDGMGGSLITPGTKPFQVVNDGLGGEDSYQEGSRFDALPVYLTLRPNNMVPASGSIGIGSADISLDLLWSASSVYYPTSRLAYLAGVLGTLTRAAGGAKGAGNYTWTRAVAGTAVPFGPGGLLRMDVDAYTNSTMVLWSGRNDDATQFAATKANIAAILGRLTPLSKRFLVLGLYTKSDGSEAVGSAVCNEIIAHNAALAVAYNNRFFDVRDYFINHAIDDAIALGIMPARTSDQIIADNTARNAGNVPPTLLDTNDFLHPLPFAYQLLANQLYGRMVQQGWVAF